MTIVWSDMSVLAAASGNQFSGGGGSTFSTPMSSLKLLLVTSLSLPNEDLIEEVK